MKADRKTDFIIREILLELGMPDSLRGHAYSVAAISRCVDNPDAIDGITKGLYPAIAAACGTTKSGVERGIRHGVELVWDRGDYDVLQHYFGNTVSPDKGKPTNKEFISRIAAVVRQRMED